VFNPYLAERLGTGVRNAQVSLRELRQRGYDGGGGRDSKSGYICGQSTDPLGTGRCGEHVGIVAAHH